MKNLQKFEYIDSRFTLLRKYSKGWYLKKLFLQRTNWGMPFISGYLKFWQGARGGAVS